MAALEAEIFGDEQKDDLPEEFKTMSTEDIQRRCGHGRLAASRLLPTLAAWARLLPRPGAHC